MTLTDDSSYWGEEDATETVKVPPQPAQDEELALQAERGSVIFEKCMYCKQPIWATWSKDTQREMGAIAVMPYADQLGPLIVCAKCDRLYLERRARGEEKFSDYKRDYSKPPTDIVLKNPEIWKWAQNWNPNKKHENLIIWGDKGVGKSSLCRFLLSRFSKLNCKSIDAIDIEGQWWKDSYSQQSINAKMCDILLIDDVGSVGWTARGIDVFRSIIDCRHEHRKTTLITSNKPPKGDTKDGEYTQGLTDMFDDVLKDKIRVGALMDRLYPCQVFHMVGTSARREAQVAYQKGI